MDNADLSFLGWLSVQTYCREAIRFVQSRASPDTGFDMAVGRRTLPLLATFFILPLTTDGLG